jgi:hypothetical protein
VLTPFPPPRPSLKASSARNSLCLRYKRVSTDMGALPEVTPEVMPEAEAPPAPAPAPVVPTREAAPSRSGKVVLLRGFSTPTPPPRINPTFTFPPPLPLLPLPLSWYLHMEAASSVAAMWEREAEKVPRAPFSRGVRGKRKGEGVNSQEFTPPPLSLPPPPPILLLLPPRAGIIDEGVKDAAMGPQLPIPDAPDEALPVAGLLLLVVVAAAAREECISVPHSPPAAPASTFLKVLTSPSALKARVRMLSLQTLLTKGREGGRGET